MSHDPLAQACDAASAAVPTIWLFGKTQAGKTSIVAEITDQAHDDIGNGFQPMTQGVRLYAFPAAAPVLRFLDTRGLGDVAGAPDLPLAPLAHAAHLLLVVARADDLDLDEVLIPLRAVLKAQPDWPLIVAQTTLHHGYGRHDRHLLPYPFTGEDTDFALPGLPDALRQTLQAQRQLFTAVAGRRTLRFVPLDFTRPEQELPPTDYGAERLWDVLEELLPETVARLHARHLPPSVERLRTRVILPGALMAAATNALPAPVLGGIAATGVQAMMVRELARRLGFAPDMTPWKEFVATLGSGFALGFGGRWLVQQGLKLAPLWGAAVVASWTFAITWALGEAALYYFGEKAQGREPDPAATRARYYESLRSARTLYEQRKGRQP